ncbi:MAG: exodeoxyribonuclease VII large subunit [Actinobacteria bacterium]|uniref:Exodeoxyribonuclease 7 large subunit n=1 Tax=Candidatus Fonsibacter lacus TaxID=2576439 RepID=A0A965GC78_9PROT|nr:exodeoxyribonuclease VII large subunit [Candidatus Fonsibacter lacus]
MIESSSEEPLPVRVVSESIGEYVGRLGPVWVEGEVAEITRRPGSQMAFMRLKDTSVDMSLQVTCHKSILEAIDPLPENARIVAYAKVNWYAVRGTLSLMAREIRQVGLGELLARLEQLKNLLAAEGLFASERKRELPFLPRKIGLICGRASAAEKDVVENVERRWPGMPFEIREVAVQGSTAVIEVSRALIELDAIDDVDVIIVTRGGGSFEDLLPFSDESLIRLVASLTTPIVSAIGHEQDAPLLDLVADLRASTPTDAAKRVVPSLIEEREHILQLSNRLEKRMFSIIELEISRLSALLSRPVIKEPLTIVNNKAEEIKVLCSDGRKALSSRLREEKIEVREIKARIAALSPLSTLKRGYAVVQKKGKVLLDAKDVALSERLDVVLSKGEIAVEVVTAQRSKKSKEK